MVNEAILNGKGHFSSIKKCSEILGNSKYGITKCDKILVHFSYYLFFFSLKKDEITRNKLVKETFLARTLLLDKNKFFKYFNNVF